MSYWVYMVRCNDNSLYTGYTTDVARRVLEHNESDKGAKYTSARRPCVLVYAEKCENRSVAMKREYFIKHKLTKKQKELMIREYDNGTKCLDLFDKYCKK